MATSAGYTPLGGVTMWLVFAVVAVPVLSVMAALLSDVEPARRRSLTQGRSNVHAAYAHERSTRVNRSGRRFAGSAS